MELEAYSQTQSDFTAAGFGVQSPVIDWNASDHFPSRTLSPLPPVTARNGHHGDDHHHRLQQQPDQRRLHGRHPGVADAGYNGTFVVTGKPRARPSRTPQPPRASPASGGGTAVSPAGPSYAQTWDGRGPFYGQTYMEFLGVDSSTCEMDDNSSLEGPPGLQVSGRLKAKEEQYLDFYSAGAFWLDHRQAMMNDQLTMFEAWRQERPDRSQRLRRQLVLTGLGFTNHANNWMIRVPVRPTSSRSAARQRSDAEANRLVGWLLPKRHPGRAGRQERLHLERDGPTRRAPTSSR